MVLGLQDRKHELVYLSNEDEDTPKRLVGKKEVPIYRMPDGTLLLESLVIVAKLEEAGPTLDPASGRPELKAWLDATAQLLRQLCYPRWVAAGFPEFVSEAGRAYFTKKKETTVGPFKDVLARTDELKKEMEKHLAELDPLLKSTDSINGGAKLSMDDIVFFPKLRGVSIVKDLVWPPRVRQYIESVAKRTKVDLHDDVAR